MKTFHRILCSVFSFSLFAAATLQVEAAAPGSLVAWGSGATNTNVEPEYGQAIVPSGLAGVTTGISGGLYHSLALKTDGSVIAWGNNAYNQCTVPAGLGTVTVPQATLPANPAGTLKAVTMTVATTVSDAIVIGMNVTGTGLGTGSTVFSKATAAGVTTVTLSVPYAASNFDTYADLLFTPVSLVTSVAAGGFHSLAMKSDTYSGSVIGASVVAWGAGTAPPTTAPQLGQSVVPAGLISQFNAPVMLPANTTGLVATVTLTPVNANIVAGMAVTGPSNTVGLGAKVLSVSGATVTLSVPNLNTFAGSTTLNFYADVKAIAAGIYHSVALKNDGAVLAWGDNSEAQTTVPAGLVSLTSLASISSNTSVTPNLITLAANPGILPGMLVTGPAGTVGAGAVVLSKDTSVVPNKLLLSVNNANSGASAVVQTLTFSPSAPVVAIAAGNAHTVAMKSDGTVVAWGRNIEGQTLGLATVATTATLAAPVLPSTNPSNYSVTVASATGIAPGMLVIGPPLTVGAGAKVVSVSGLVVTLSAYNVNTILTSGAALTFSSGTKGTAIAAGGDNTYVLKADGTVLAFGDNTNGQITGAAAITGATAISAGGDHALALKADTTVTAWGKIWNGSTYVSEVVPTGLTGVTAIAAGGYHSLAITAAPIVNAPPIIITQPANVTVNPGGTVTLSVTASGGSTYQWYKEGVAIPGATGPTYTITNAQLSDIGSYTVMVTNSAGVSVLSNVATVSWSHPIVTSQPLSLVLKQGESASFDIQVTGQTPLTYQWKKDGVVIATSANSSALYSVLSLPNVQPSSMGSYSVTITNSIGSVNTKIASLKVVPTNIFIKPEITSPTNSKAVLPQFSLIKGVAMIPYTITTNTSVPITYSAKNLPKGLAVNAKTGVLSGKPTVKGTYMVTLQAKSQSAGMASAYTLMKVN